MSQYDGISFVLYSNMISNK